MAPQRCVVTCVCLPPASTARGAAAASAVGPIAGAGRSGLILQELARHDAAATFQGLRRRLGLHPETLTRTLRRLQEDGEVEHDEDGYRLTDQGRDMAPPTAPAMDDVEVLRMLLASDLDPEALAAALAGRWFESLRWFGQAVGPGERTLLWVTEPDGRMVRLRLVAGMVIVEVEGPWDEAVEAFAGLRGLLAALAQHL